MFYLAAKTSGRQLALDALRQIRASAAHPPLRGGLPQAPLRVLELVARDKACEHPDKACHGDSCPLARGFYDRLPAARQAAVDEASVASPAPQATGCAEGVLFDKATLREIALRHDVCPYYLGQELARWADVVVGDYNYWFDTSAMLFAMTQMEGWRVAVLVDEAHNLVERARGMYSAELEQGALKALRRAATAVSPPLKRTLDRLNRPWNELQRDQATPYVAADDIPAAFTEALHQTLGHADRPDGRPTRARGGCCCSRAPTCSASLSTRCTSRASPQASGRIRCSTSRCGPAARRCPGDRPHPPCASATSSRRRTCGPALPPRALWCCSPPR